MLDNSSFNFVNFYVVGFASEDAVLIYCWLCVCV